MNNKKTNVAIITELRKDKYNYGGTLQAFALNHYLNNIDNVSAKTLFISPLQKQRYTNRNIKNYLKKKIKGYMSILRKYRNKDRCSFKKFINKNINVSEKEYNYKKLKNSKFDIFVVGSDVVWIQSKGCVNQIKFLNFNNKRNAKKISYAASFGGNVIPDENKKEIGKCLEKFDAISVREKSSIDVLSKINIKNVIHVMDPTLLIENKEWEGLMAEPRGDFQNYIFAYILGNNVAAKENILNISQKMKMNVVFVNEEGYMSVTGINNAETYCSINSWLWLIKNANYVFTDSFHGIVFSTIFKKKFIVYKRMSKNNINTRITDFLATIDSSDKYVQNVTEEKIKDFKWDYINIEEKLKFKIEESKNYIEKNVK